MLPENGRGGMKELRQHASRNDDVEWSADSRWADSTRGVNQQVNRSIKQRSGNRIQPGRNAAEVGVAVQGDEAVEFRMAAGNFGKRIAVEIHEMDLSEGLDQDRQVEVIGIPGSQNTKAASLHLR